ncbi:MBL fold metallo-hydrolase [Pseudohoeflea coraliihabitans]|uniref:MBL fold metallo-hydrolase n=1 Tax=Pseudohoeflea coraliihabitans TaxID=2860393 RepID=A0ABS6WSN7_9HYPH|nr:MBL fold metallo-hydrolase [Pseudohoeflea sp. DP4N28-3]
MRTIDSGSLQLSLIRESVGAAFPPATLFPDFGDEIFARAPVALGPSYYNAEKQKLVSSIHSWLLCLDGKLVLIDTGYGRGKENGIAEAPFFLSLAAAGVAPADIDLVVLTHLHTDHMKNNTIATADGWRPAFPNARYVVGRREYAHWQPGGAGLALHPGQAPILAETVVPLVEAGCLDLIDDETELLPGLRTMPVPGHTATQLALLIDNGEQLFVHAADSIHHPLQVHRPEWGSSLCEDGPLALRSRLKVLDLCAERGAILMASHFAGTGAASITRSADGFHFEPVEITRSPRAAHPEPQPVRPQAV